MKFQIICNKLRYYVRWYQSMMLAERKSAIGAWVRERIEIYTEIITEAETAFPRSTAGGGNYKSSILN